MKNLIAVATAKDKKSLWPGHFGVSPFYSIFDEEGNLIETRENPFSKDKHHDDPFKVKEFLSDVSTFVGKNMGQKSRKKLTEKLKVRTMLVDAEDIYDAIKYYLDAKKNIDVFERCTDKYEDWFDKYPAVYESEINMLKGIMPKWDKAIEIGVGSGRFAYPLGIKEGVEPSESMSKIAQERGIKIYPGFAENLPILDEEYDFVLMAVTICFVKDPIKSLKEVYRILKKGGKTVVAIVDRETAIGKEYLRKKEKGEFYKNVNFFSTEELIDMMKNTGFEIEGVYQTLFADSIKEIKEPQPYKEGYSEGGFVAVIGKK